MSVYTFETERLFLRPPKAAYAEAIFMSSAQDPEVTKFLIWCPHTDVKTTRAFLADCLKRREEDVSHPFVILLKETRELFGMLEFRVEGFKADFGYVLAKKHWGRGYMTEAMKPALAWVLSFPAVKRVWATHDEDNQASGKVMRKLGMTFEGVLHAYALHPNVSDEPRDCAIYAILK